MHTFFINTSEKASISEYRDILFGELLAKQSLIIPADTVVFSHDSLSDCARKIALKIDLEADITEDIALVVYIENDDKDMSFPQRIAEEILRSLIASTSLVWKLCEMGKRPGQLIFIFGETSIEDIRHETLKRKVNEYLWQRMEIPTGTDTLEYIKKEAGKIRIDHDPEKMADLKRFLLELDFENWENSVSPENKSRYRNILEFYDNFKEFLTKTPCTCSDYVLSRKDCECYEPVIIFLVRQIIFHLMTTIQETKTQDLYSCLKAALDIFRDTRMHDRINDRYAESLYYRYFPLKIKDPFERHRSICEMMIYLYAIAYNNNLSEKGSNRIELVQPEYPRDDIIKAYRIPEISEQGFTKLTRYLINLAARNEQADFSLPDLPPQMNHDIGDQNIAEKSIHDPDEFFQNIRFPKIEPDEKREIARIKESLITEELPGRITSRKALKNAVDHILSQIREINFTNQEKVENYLSAAASEYDRKKKEWLPNVPFAIKFPPILSKNDFFAFFDKLEQYKRESRNQTEKNVKEMLEIPSDPRKMKVKNVKDLLDNPAHFLTSEDILQKVEEAKARTDYCFTSLNSNIHHLAAGILLILLILLPYGIIQKKVFSKPDGYLFFILSGGVAAICFLVGRCYFIERYKNKIKEIICRLIGEFDISQAQNKACVDHYRRLMYELIPACYAAHRYETELSLYENTLGEFREKRSYHIRMKEKRFDQIETLLNFLDLSKGKSLKQLTALISPGKGIIWKINPRLDCVGNRDYYLLSPDEIQAILDSKGDAQG